MKDNNLFSIGEIAKSIGVTRRIILNYEAKGLIQPDKKEGATGNRYYTINTFTQIRTIRIFQKLGLSLDEVREYLFGESNLQPVIKRLEHMRDELNLSIEKLVERSDQTNRTIKEIEMAPQAVYVRKHSGATIEDKTNYLQETALEAMRQYGTDTSRRMYFTEYSVQAPQEVLYRVAVPRESTGAHIIQLPAFRAVSVFHHGAYEEIPQTRERLVEYARAHHIELSGVFRNLYLEGPPQHKDKSKFVTQIIAIAK